MSAHPLIGSRFGGRKHILAAILLFCGLMAFIPNLNASFLADDYVLFSWTQAHSLAEVFAFFDPHTWWFYRPIIKVIYWLSQSIFGLQPLPLHLLALVLHGLMAFLLYYLLAQQRRVAWSVALAAALVFLLNAHHAETTAWSAAIGDLIAGCCILGSLICFNAYAQQRRIWPRLVFWGLFAVGLLTRETTTLLPFLVLLDLLVFGWPRRESAGRVGLAYGGYVAILLSYGLLQLLGHPPGSDSVARGGLHFHLLNIDSVLLAILDYVHGLVPGGSYLLQLPLPVLQWLVWVEWIGLCALGIALWRTGQRVALWGLLWMLVTPLLFVFLSAPSDRYFYIPALGYAVLVASLLVQWPHLLTKVRPAAHRPARWLAGGVIGGLLLFQMHDLLVREAMWSAAGQMSERVLQEVHQAIPNPHDYGAFYFIGLPGTLGGVPVFLDGLPQAIQLTYARNQTLATYLVTCPELLRTQLPRYSYFFRYTGRGVEPLARAQDCP